MLYTINGRKRLRMAENWSDILLIGLGVVALGLLILDYVFYGNLMTYVFTGIK